MDVLSFCDAIADHHIGTLRCRRGGIHAIKTSEEIIRQSVMLNARFPLSLRNVEDLLHERGIDVSHEAVQFWCLSRTRPNDPSLPGGIARRVSYNPHKRNVVMRDQIDAGYEYPATKNCCRACGRRYSLIRVSAMHSGPTGVRARIADIIRLPNILPEEDWIG